MKCPKCDSDMFLAYTEAPRLQTLAVWVCTRCYYEQAVRRKRPLKLEYDCAFCGNPFRHIQTDDHTPLAELICQQCADGMGIELQTHPDDPENEDNPFSIC